MQNMVITFPMSKIPFFDSCIILIISESQNGFFQLEIKCEKTVKVDFNFLMTMLNLPGKRLPGHMGAAANVAIMSLIVYNKTWKVLQLIPRGYFRRKFLFFLRFSSAVRAQLFLRCALFVAQATPSTLHFTFSLRLFHAIDRNP